MTKIVGFLVAFLLLASLPAVAAGDVTKTVFIGDREIALPVIEGYKEVYGSNARFDGLARQLVPPGNRLLGVYLLPEDAQAIKEGTQTAMKRYIIVQTLKDDISIETAEGFTRFKMKVLAEAGADLGSDPEALREANRISDYIRENYDQNAEIKAGETKILEAFIDNEKALGISMIANIGLDVGSESRSIPVGLSLLAINLQGKPIFVTVYTVYSGAKDSDVVKQAGTTLVNKLFLVNGEDAPTLSVGSSTHAQEEADAADERLSYAMVVTGVLCVLVLGFFLLAPLYRRFSRNDRDESI